MVEDKRRRKCYGFGDVRITEGEPEYPEEVPGEHRSY